MNDFFLLLGYIDTKTWFLQKNKNKNPMLLLNSEHTTIYEKENFLQ